MGLVEALISVQGDDAHVAVAIVASFVYAWVVFRATGAVLSKTILEFFNQGECLNGQWIVQVAWSGRYVEHANVG